MIGSDFTSKGLVLKERAYIGGASPPDTFEDESRHGNDGVHTNITWVRRPSGLWVRSFNGSSSLVSFNLGTNTSSKSQTIIVWVYPTLAWESNNIYVWDIQTGRFLLGSDIGVAFSLYDGSWQAWGVAPALNVWTQCAVRLNGDTSKATLLLNGQLAGSELTYTPSTANDVMTFGANYAGGSPFYNGSNCLAKMFDYVLSVEHIASIFESERRWFGV